MLISIITLFPEIFTGFLTTSIVKRALTKKTLDVQCINPRDFASDKYKSVDDHPYGGGAGMVLRVDVMEKAIIAARSALSDQPARVILLDPQGVVYSQRKARLLTGERHIILVCGHYEGFDERIRSLVDEELSIGDYVLTGGELPAMVVTDSVARLIPGTLARKSSTAEESFESDLLEYPQYTRPETHNGVTVPPVLLSGNHKRIADWRRAQAVERTKKRRPDLLASEKNS